MENKHSFACFVRSFIWYNVCMAEEISSENCVSEFAMITTRENQVIANDINPSEIGVVSDERIREREFGFIPSVHSCTIVVVNL